VSAGEVLRTTALPWRVHGSSAPLWWGILLVVAIETTVFATLISSYLYLRASSPQWPPADVPLPDLLLPGINTVVLLTSSVAVLWASRGLAKGNQRQLELGLGAGIVLEVAFFVIKLIESRGFGYGWGTHAYASIFWSISGLHTLHVLIAILMAAAAGVLALRGYYTKERSLGIQVVSIYWQFVAAIWIPVAFVLYLVPRWL
jgi:cytochrome c oxidase subunit I+III